MYWGYYFCYILYTHYTQYTGKCQWTAQYILTHTLHLRSIKKIVGDLHEYIQRPYISIHLYATWTVQLRSYTWQMQFSSYRTYKAFNGLKAQTTTHTHTNRSRNRSAAGSFAPEKWERDSRPGAGWYPQAKPEMGTVELKLRNTWLVNPVGLYHGCPPKSCKQDEKCVQHPKGWRPSDSRTSSGNSLNLALKGLYDCKGGRVWVKQFIYFNTSIKIPWNKKRNALHGPWENRSNFIDP